MAFKICKKNDCKLTITDLNEEFYPKRSILSKSGTIYYTFEESSTVNALISINYDNERSLKDYLISPHYTINSDEEVINVTDECDLTFENDGLYEVSHIIIPTKEYVLKYQDLGLSDYFPNGVYFTDNGKVYCKLLNTIEEVSVELLTEVNTEGTTIIKEIKNTFSLCRLQDCFYNLCKILLNNLCGCKRDCDKAKTYAQDIFNRDLIWMVLNTIKYAIEQGQYFEAQRILENISGCGNICSLFYSDNTSKNLGCGCN